MNFVGKSKRDFQIQTEQIKCHLNTNTAHPHTHTHAHRHVKAFEAVHSTSVQTNEYEQVHAHA